MYFQEVSIIDYSQSNLLRNNFINMFCEKCGHKVPEDSAFCDSCGEKISGNMSIPNNIPNIQNEKANKHNKKVLFIVLGIVALFVIIAIFFDSSNDSKKNSTQTDNISTEDWKEFNSIEGKFKVIFPKFPSHETENIDIKNVKNQPKMELYTSEQSDDIAYLVSYIPYSNEFDFSNPKTSLENSVNGSLQNLEGGKLVSSSFSKYSNYDAIDYVLYSSKEDMYIKGKNIIVGNTLYSLAVTYRQKSVTDIQTDKFFNSFQLTQNSTSTTGQNTQSDTNEIDPVTKADYQEGYKAGYVDGRASKGQLGDNYAEPATEERKGAYLIGYLDGFLKGCREGGFDCSAVENAINSLDKDSTTNVNLIPPSIN